MEMVLLTPLMVVLVLFVVHSGRAGTVVEQVRHAADQGARAASMMSTDRQSTAARWAVAADLHRNGVGCVQPDVAVRTGASGSVRTVTVTVSCSIDTTGLRLLGVGERRVHASSTEPIDRYRGGR